MAKKKTINKKDAINPKGGTSEREDWQLKAIMDGVYLIQQAIKVAMLKINVQGGGMAETICAMGTVVGDFIQALAESCEMSQQEAMESFFNTVRHCVNDDLPHADETDLNLS